MAKKIGLGSKKDLTADLNLTPFIDLLSTMVCFLLITAVWIEIGSVEIKQSHGTEGSASKEISFDLDLVYKNAENLRLNLKRNGKRVRGIDIKAASATEFQAKLDEALKTSAVKFKNKEIKISTATITPRSTVDYGQLVATLDTLRKNNIINIGVLSAKGQ